MTVADISAAPAVGSRHGHLDALTGLRGIAAYAVLVAHAIDVSFYYAGVPIFHPFAARLAYFGMSLFFVLSGFVIWYNYADSFRRGRLSVATGRFFAARFARLYPLYVVALLVSLPHLPVQVFSEFPAVGFSYLTLTQSWWNVQNTIFVPFWSVSAEWLFYLAFVPLLFLLATAHRAFPILTIYLAVTFVVALVFFSIVVAPIKAGQANWLRVDPKLSASPWTWVSYFSPYLRLLEFIAGMLAARVYAQCPLKGSRAAPWPSQRRLQSRGAAWWF